MLIGDSRYFKYLYGDRNIAFDKDGLEGKGVFMFRYWMAVLIVGAAVGNLFAAAGDEHTFELQWQEIGFNQQVEGKFDYDRDKPFDKEPNLSNQEVFRGELEIGLSEKKEKMGFVWYKSEGKLYVDLNRDGDLTNDPNGVLKKKIPMKGRIKVRISAGV